MSQRSRYTKEEKYEILKEIELGNMNIEAVCEKFNISYSNYENWRYLYYNYGINSLEESRTWNKYFKELKELAVLEYLKGEDSKINICRKYKISSHSVLSRWIKRYNSHKKFKTTGGRKDDFMTNC